MKEYLQIFIDEEYPHFLDKYTKTKTLERIKHVSQFCGCDYTRLYSPRFFYTRFDHSLVIAHMTWHFTHDKKATIASLLHDAGTPCFSHCIDYVFDDYLNQESGEKDILDIIKEDDELIGYLREDDMTLEDLSDLTKYPILENKSPKLCTDRLDGVLHTAYIWLHTHELEDIKEVYDDIVVLTNEDGANELGFKTLDIALKFVSMVSNYAKELQSNTDKYTMKYISEVVKCAVEKNLITLESLYSLKEKDIVEIFASKISSWPLFEAAEKLKKTENMPINRFYISFETKKRNVIPLVRQKTQIKRIDTVSEYARDTYNYLKNYKDTTYAYIDSISKID